MSCRAEKTLTKTRNDTDDLEAKLAVIDLKRKKLEKKASARRLNLDLASAPGSASDTINAQTDGAAATAPIFDASAHSPSQSLPIEAIETDTTSDDDIPTWASSQKSDKGNVLSALGSDYNGLEGSGKKSPEDGNLSPRGHDDDNGDSRYGHSPSLSRTISMGDGGRESATESPIPALFMAGVGARLWSSTLLRTLADFGLQERTGTSIPWHHLPPQETLKTRV